MNALRFALLAALVLAVVAGALRWHRDVPPRAAGELRIVHGSIRLSLDPRVARDRGNLSQRLIDALWEPLFAIDARGDVQAAAAETWEISPDFQRITVRLRAGLRWSNGEPVTATDFIRTVEWFERSRRSGGLITLLQSRAEGAPRAAAEALRALDERTLAINLPQPTPGVLFVLATARWIPLHASSIPVLETESYRAHPEGLVTSGPFRLAEANQRSWRLVRDPHSRLAGDVALASVRTVRTDGPTLYPTVIDADLADVSDGMPYLRRRLDPVAPPARLLVENTTGVSVLHFNTLKPPLDDERVRRALSLALDRAALASALTQDGGLPAFSCMPSADDERPGRTVDEDLAEARRLLAEAGYPDGRGLPVLRLPLVRSTVPNPMAYFCADQWRARLGIRVYVIPLPLEDIGARLARGDFDLMHYYWTLDRSDVSLFASAPLAGLPPPYRVNLSPDQARELAVARGLRGELRREAMKALERAVLADTPCTPVVFYRRCHVVGPDVRGWEADVMGEHPFAALGVAERPRP